MPAFAAVAAELLSAAFTGGGARPAGPLSAAAGRVEPSGFPGRSSCMPGSACCGYLPTCSGR